MYISSKQFVSLCIENGLSHEDLGVYVEVALTLLKNHGSAIYTSGLFERIYEVDESFGDFLLLLRKADKGSITSLRKLSQSITQQFPGGEPVIQVKSSNPESVGKRIKEIYKDSQVESEELPETGLFVQRGGEIYKRTLENDIDKIVHA